MFLPCTLSLAYSSAVVRLYIGTISLLPDEVHAIVTHM